MNKRTVHHHITWKLYEVLAMHIGLGTLAIFCLSWLPFAAVLHLLLPRKIGQILGRRVISWGFRAYLGILKTLCACHLDLTAIDTLAKQGPMIIVANHPSLLDAVLITSRLPNAVCVMKSSLMDNIFFGAAARLAGYVRNDVPLTMILESTELLQHGGQVVIFPEGTRTRNFPIEPCLPVIGLMAQRCGVPIQALMIEFSSAYLGKNWPLWRPPSLPLKLSIKLGSRFESPTDANEFNKTLQAHFQTTLSSRADPQEASS
jgi:1-acyl-sn-glycerol-3-phosphate acyltransferase